MHSNCIYGSFTMIMLVGISTKNEEFKKAEIVKFYKVDYVRHLTLATAY